MRIGICHAQVEMQDINRQEMLGSREWEPGEQLTLHLLVRSGVSQHHALGSWSGGFTPPWLNIQSLSHIVC